MGRRARPCANCEDAEIEAAIVPDGDLIYCSEECRVEAEGD